MKNENLFKTVIIFFLFIFIFCIMTGIFAFIYQHYSNQKVDIKNNILLLTESNFRTSLDCKPQSKERSFLHSSYVSYQCSLINNPSIQFNIDMDCKHSDVKSLCQVSMF